MRAQSVLALWGGIYLWPPAQGGLWASHSQQEVQTHSCRSWVPFQPHKPLVEVLFPQHRNSSICSCTYKLLSPVLAVPGLASCPKWEGWGRSVSSMDTAKLGPQLHLQGSAKAAPPRGRAASPQQIPHSQKADVSTNTTTLLRVLKAHKAPIWQHHLRNQITILIQFPRQSKFPENSVCVRYWMVQNAEWSLSLCGSREQLTCLGLCQCQLGLLPSGSTPGQGSTARLPETSKELLYQQEPRPMCVKHQEHTVLQQHIPLDVSLTGTSSLLGEQQFFLLWKGQQHHVIFQDI